MKKLSLILLTLFLCFCNIVCYAEVTTKLVYDGSTHDYKGPYLILKVDNKYVYTPICPVVFNGRTLVPLREVFEAMGATVDYEVNTKKVYINYNNDKLVLQIGNSTASINGKNVTIPDGVVPKLIGLEGQYAKTMIPVRFASETLGMNVSYDAQNLTINISTKKQTTTTQPTVEKSTIKGYSVDSKTQGVVKLKVDFTKAIESYTNPVKTGTGVLYVDIPNSTYSISNSIDINKGAIKKMRLGIHENSSRICLDLDNATKYEVNLANDKKSITFTVYGTATTSTTTTATASTTDTKTNTETKADTTTKPVKTQTHKIVVIDAGHGGKDPGTCGYIGDGTKQVELVTKTLEDGTEITEEVESTKPLTQGEKYLEKDVNLSVAKKLSTILEKDGIKTILTRDTDVFLELTERSQIANENSAVFFVSIHSNYAENSTANGYDVYYSELNNSDSTTGVTSKELANKVINSLSKSVTTKKRSVKTADHVVTRTSKMPAILIEVGFMSNEEELKQIITSDFQTKFATGIANGIKSLINEANIPNQ